MNAPHFTALHPSSNFANDRTLFLAGFDGVFKSTDAAATWGSLEADALGRIEGIALSPQYHTDQTLAFSTYRLGAFLSTDGGRQWSVIWRGLKKQLMAVALSPDFTTDRTLFLSTSADGVRKSVDGGDTWKAVRRAPKRGTKGLGIAISQTYTKDQTVWISNAEGLIKSVDGGKSWTVLDYPYRRENAPLAAFAISPTYAKDGLILISVQGRGLFQYDHEQHAFTPTGTKLIERHYVLNDIVFSPTFALDNTLYGASAKALLRSIDGGKTWQLVETPASPKAASRQGTFDISLR
jgi:photosystem II stability/assembly factor-like uncharacterized protein